GSPMRSFSHSAIVRTIGPKLSNKYYHLVAIVLNTLVDNKTIFLNGNEYSFNLDKLKKFTGELVSIIPAGGFVKVEGFEDDVIVGIDDLSNALLGDIVEVATYPSRKKGRLEGIVTNIIKKSDKKYIGTIEISKNFAFVIADKKSMPYDIFVPLKEIGDAKDGDRVSVVIESFPKGSRNPVGAVSKVLGKPGDNDTEINAIMEEFSLPYEFPKEVLDFAESIPDIITDKERGNRRDCRDITTFTIDPADAKDFDDALSIRKLDNGFWEVGVHIADVTHYVREGSVLDDEALLRATSVYLVDRVVPMLPERLSNGICSLRPDEEKLCFSCILEMDDKAKVHSKWFGRTVIKSNCRYAYEEAQKVIEGGEDKYAAEILKLDELAKILRAERYENGSIAFERDEVKFVLEEGTGKPLGVYFKEMKDSNHLIEEFMLLANRSVAEYVAQKNKTFVYRVHDKPKEDKFREFTSFITRFGYVMKAKDNRDISKEMNVLLADIKGKTMETLLTTLA
ncbi:MAG: RNB domain-containing ribonuclease, partial [Rikenellaceae bacterium]